MNYAVIMAGFGGQGILMIGNVLAIGALRQDLNVTFFPSYGVEMRGGTANCTVTIATKEVGSPVTSKPNGLIAMNEPSLVKFGPRVLAGGLAVVNTSIISEEAIKRSDIDVLRVPCNQIAAKLGTDKLASMVALGAFVGRTGLVTAEHIETALTEVLPKKAHKLIPSNIEALREGARLAAAK